MVLPIDEYSGYRILQPMQGWVYLLMGGILISGLATTPPTVNEEAHRDPYPIRPASIPAASNPVVSSNAFSRFKPAQLTVTNGQQILTLVESQRGKITLVNPGLRFVVIDYGLNPLPAPNQRIFFYRQNRRLGELRITGPQRDSQIVANLREGTPQIGDEVRND